MHLYVLFGQIIASLNMYSRFVFIHVPFIILILVFMTLSCCQFLPPFKGVTGALRDQMRHIIFIIKRQHLQVLYSEATGTKQ